MKNVVHFAVAEASDDAMNSLPRFTNARMPVLVVDADDDTRALYRQCLALADCDVVEATDGRDALVKAFVHKPMLILTELRLPFVDGFALCEILRQDRTTINVPVLVVTSERRPAELNRARRIADVVLTKTDNARHLGQ